MNPYPTASSHPAEATQAQLPQNLQLRPSKSTERFPALPCAGKGRGEGPYSILRFTILQPVLRACAAFRDRTSAAATLLLGLALSSVPALAELPEPDTVFFGTIAIDNAFVTGMDNDVTVELRRTQDGPPIAEYPMGTNPAHGDRYVIRARVESGLPVIEPDASLLGSTVWLTVSKAGIVREGISQVLSSRGRFVALNFGDLDSDGDGIQDGWENTHFGSATGADPLGDPDGDYRTNLQEFLDGTNPLTPDGRHSADAAPADWEITLGEVTAYASAWLRGDPWPTGPQPSNTLLVDFVTSAGNLWLGGEVYVFDNVPATNAPLWWVNPPAPPALADAAIPSDPAKPRRALAGLSAETSGVSIRTSSDALISGQPVTITLNVTPGQSVDVYAVEERLPVGWTVRNISANGSSDTRLGRIRWGPYFDNQPRSFTFVATPPADLSGAFTGVASFDGRSVAAEGLIDVSSANTSGTLTVRVVSAAESSIQVSGAPGTAIVLQSSQDLKQWTQVGEGLIGADGSVLVPTVPTGGPTFFRALRAPSSL